MANTGSLKFISAKTGSGIHQETEELAGVVSLIQEQQIFPIDAIKAEENEVHITFVIENTSLSIGYTLTECGIFAKEEGTAQEVLFAIGIPVDDILIPGTSDNEYYRVSEICEFVIVTSNANGISLEIPELAHVLKTEFNEKINKIQTFIDNNTVEKISGNLSQWLQNDIEYNLASVIYSNALQCFVAVGTEGEFEEECCVKSKDLLNWEKVFEKSASRSALTLHKCISNGNDIFYTGSLQNSSGKYPYLGWYKEGVAEGKAITDVETEEGCTAIALSNENVYIASKEGLFTLGPEDDEIQTVCLSENFPSNDMYIGEDICICVGGNSIMVSTDLVNFEKKTLAQMTEITKVLKIEDAYFVLGEGNYMAKSEDGYNWEYISLYTSEKIVDAIAYKNIILGISSHYLYPINLQESLNSVYNKRIKITDNSMQSITYGNGLIACVGENNSNICKWWIAHNLKEALYDTGWSSDGVEHNISNIDGPTDTYPIEYRRIGNRVELRGRLYTTSEASEVILPLEVAPAKPFAISKIWGTANNTARLVVFYVKTDGHITCTKSEIGEASAYPSYWDFGNIGWYID